LLHAGLIDVASHEILVCYLGAYGQDHQ
jgi:hypothetical protein